MQRDPAVAADSWQDLAHRLCEHTLSVSADAEPWIIRHHDWVGSGGVVAFVERRSSASPQPRGWMVYDCFGVPHAEADDLPGVAALVLSLFAGRGGSSLAA